MNLRPPATTQRPRDLQAGLCGLVVALALGGCGLPAATAPGPTLHPPLPAAVATSTVSGIASETPAATAAVGAPEFLPRVDLSPDNWATVIDHPYLPYTPGSRYVYEGQTDAGFERTVVQVLTDTKTILGVTTTVVRDTVHVDGQLVEDTYDWFAQDAAGNVWYFGEDVSNYAGGQLSDKAGSWEAGVDGAQPGIVMLADPAAHVGETYLQEYYAGHAEDTARLLSTGERAAVPYGTFEDVVKIYEFTPLDPALQEYKFYAPGVGKTHDLDLTTGEVVALVAYVPAGDPLQTLPVAPQSARVDLGTPTFSTPTRIDNPLFPVSQTDQVLLLGQVDGQPLSVAYTRLPTTRPIEWNGTVIETIAVQYVAHLNGRIVEHATDWYAQADDGAVWYFGEDVFNYTDGALTDTHGTWLAGRDGPPAMIMPAQPQVGDAFRVENIPGLVFEEITVTATHVTVLGPRGPVTGALIAEQRHQDGAVSNKTFAPGYGEFATVLGRELEAVALAVPTDARPGPVPAALTDIAAAAASIARAAEAADWEAAAVALDGLWSAWRLVQTESPPLRLEAQMQTALAQLTGAVTTRQTVETRHEALAVARAGLDLQLQYRPVAAVDLERARLWAEQTRLDAEAADPGWVLSDVTTLELIVERMVGSLDRPLADRLSGLLAKLRAAAEAEDLEAASALTTQIGEALGNP